MVVLTGLILLLASCGGKEQPVRPASPGVRVSEKLVGSYEALFEVQALDCATLHYGVTQDMPMSLETGSTGPISTEISLSGLDPLKEYILYVQGEGPAGELGNVVTLPFSTTKGPSGAPSFADISLVTLGWHNYNPPAWTVERFASHVSYGGKWLFDAFLCIEGWDPVRSLSYSLTNNRLSSVKESWEDLLEAWLGADGALNKLDAAISDAVGELGTPPSARYIVMSVPDPTRYRDFADKKSSTTYWGQLDGRTLDFAKTEDQLAAYRWFMDRCRSLFRERGFRYLELAGFYILSEELPLDPAFYQAAGESYSQADTWNWRYKNWEILVPQVASYTHNRKEGLWWIPYHLAPGYKVWRELGLDLAFMQPNYYWDHGNISHPMSETKKALQKYRMGIELEFEYSLVASVMADGRKAPDGEGNPTFTAADVPMLRGRVREYMQMYRSTGLYGVLPFAVYSGTDAWHQLATSADPGDMEMFKELCTFIQESPLKR